MRLAGADTEPKWRRKKKDVYGHVKGTRPGVSRLFKEKIQKEACGRLEIWRLEHPFSGEMTDFLSSAAASVYFSHSRIATLRFLAGSGSLAYSGAEIGAQYITATFKEVAFKALYDLLSGRIRVSFSEENALYKRLVKAVENYKVQYGIEEYLQVKGIPASIVYAGRPGEFRISFPFDTGPETETVTVEKTYKRIVPEDVPGLWHICRAGCPGYDRRQREPPDSCADRQHPAWNGPYGRPRVRKIYRKI